MCPQYSRIILEYHIIKLLALGYSRNQIKQYCGFDVERIISDHSYFKSTVSEHYKIIKLLYETNYHKELEILDALELLNSPTLHNAYLLNSKNLIELFAKICQLHKASYLSNDLQIFEYNDFFEVRLRLHPLEASFGSSQGVLFFICAMSQSLLQSTNIIEEVGCSQGDFPDAERFSENVQTKLIFNQAVCYVKVRREVALRCVPSFNLNVSKFLEQQFSAKFPELEKNDDIKKLIVEDVLQAIHMGNLQRIFNVDFVCIRYGLSRSTLYRRLHDANTSFSEITEGLRRSESSKLLTSTFLTVSEISSRLGYSNVTAFNRAFKRWYGVPPAKFRKS